MKKLILLSLFAMLALGVSAQAGAEKNLLSADGFFNDTVTNTGTKYLNVNSTFSELNNLAVIVKVTQLSGTTAGTAIMEVSINGVDYVTHPTADTLTLVNGAKQPWSVSTEYKKYRINFTGTGTSTTKIEGKYVYKQ